MGDVFRPVSLAVFGGASTNLHDVERGAVTPQHHNTVRLSYDFSDVQYYDVRVPSVLLM